MHTDNVKSLYPPQIQFARKGYNDTFRGTVDIRRVATVAIAEAGIQIECLLRVPVTVTVSIVLLPTYSLH